jgi:hypothetical protein
MSKEAERGEGKVVVEMVVGERKEGMRMWIGNAGFLYQLAGHKVRSPLTMRPPRLATIAQDNLR